MASLTQQHKFMSILLRPVQVDGRVRILNARDKFAALEIIDFCMFLMIDVIVSFFFITFPMFVAKSSPYPPNTSITNVIWSTSKLRCSNFKVSCIRLYFPCLYINLSFRFEIQGTVISISYILRTSPTQNISLPSGRGG